MINPLKPIMGDREMVVTGCAHSFMPGDVVMISGLQPTGWRRRIYNFLNWLPAFRIEARMFLSLTEKEEKYVIVSHRGVGVYDIEAFGFDGIDFKTK